MSQVRFQIRLDNTKPLTNENLIHVNVDVPVPLGDVPYFLEMSYDDGADTLIAKFQYQNEEKHISKFDNPDFEVSYGALTGRIYVVRLKNFKELIRRQYNANRMTQLLKPVNSLKKNSDMRFKGNVDLSKEILKSSFEKAKDYHFV